MNEKKEYYTTTEQIERMKEELEHAHDGSLTQTKQTWKGRILLKKAGTVLFILLVCFLLKTWMDVMDAKSRGEVPTVFGYQIYEVQTGSMDPTLPVKSLILSRQVNQPEGLTVGTIITFVNQEGITVTHRIVDVLEINGQVRYQTKGDNAQNSIDPELLYPNQVKAVYQMKLPFRLSDQKSTGGEERE